jgi:hypothetical protein
VEFDAVGLGIGGRQADGPQKRRIELGHTRNRVIEDGRPVGDGAVSLAERSALLAGNERGAVRPANRTTVLALSDRERRFVGYAARSMGLVARAGGVLRG